MNTKVLILWVLVRFVRLYMINHGMVQPNKHNFNEAIDKMEQALDCAANHIKFDTHGRVEA